MRSKFTTTARPYETVIFRRGDEEVSLTVYATPLGTDEVLGIALPDYDFINGAAVKKTGEREIRHGQHYLYALLGIALEPSSEMESSRPKSSVPEQWEQYAEAVRAEFQAAGYVEGDLVRLVAAIRRLTTTSHGAELKGVEAAAGN